MSSRREQRCRRLVRLRHGPDCSMTCVSETTVVLHRRRTRRRNLRLRPHLEFSYDDALRWKQCGEQQRRYVVIPVEAV